MGYFQPLVIYRDPNEDRVNSVIRYIGNRVLKKNKNFLCAVVGSTGCQKYGSKVLMADGSWKEIQDIKIGDIVLSPQKDGTNKFAVVKNLSSYFCSKTFNVHKKNKNKEFLYHCSNNHSIPFYVKFNRRGTKDGKRYNIKNWWDFKEYEAQKVFSMSQDRFSHNPIGFSSFPIKEYLDKTNCEIEPYTLGVFLGDGMFKSDFTLIKNKNYDTMKRSDKKLFNKKTYRAICITSNYPQILEEISKYYKIMDVRNKQGTTAKSYAFSINEELSRQLIKCGLEGKKSGFKFIPKEAMLSDLEYRKKLLAGLIDTDGYYNKCGGYEFTLKSKQLVQDIKDLTYSIGGRTGSLKEVKKSIKSINFTGTYYKICIYLGKLELPLLVKYKLKPKEYRCCYLDSNRIAIHVKESESCLVYGFELDSDSHWYITDNWMVTKNSGKSYSSLSMAEIYSKMFNIPFDPKVHVISSLKELLILITRKDIDKVITDRSVLVFDEPQVEANSRNWQSDVNQAFGQLISTFRNQRLIIFFATPYLEMIDKQSRILFHGEFLVEGFNENTKITTVKPRFLEYNKNKGDFFRKRLIIQYKSKEKESMNITKINHWHLPLASKELIDIYERKKKKFTNDLNLKLLNSLELAEQQAEGKNKSEELFKVKELYERFGEDYVSILKEMPYLSPFTVEKYLQFIKKSKKLSQNTEIS